MSTAILTTFFNFAKYSKHSEKYNRFIEGLGPLVDNLYVAELALGDTPFTLNTKGIQLRTNSVLWYKENLFNILVSKLPANIDKVIIVDNDILFSNKNWFTDTEKALETCDVVQPYEQAYWAPAPNGMIPKLPTYSFAKACKYHLPRINSWRSLSNFHPGFAWAFHRSFFDKVGLPDRLIVGGGDGVLALAIIKKLTKVPEYKTAFNKPLQDYFKEVEQNIGSSFKTIGFVHGFVDHIYHGSWNDRAYAKRWNILKNYDPKSLEVGENGLLQLPANSPFNVDIMSYFNARKEDN